MRLRAASFGVTRSCLNKVYLSVCQRRYQATAVPECVGTSESPKWITICGQPYPRDAWFNIPPRIIGLSDRRLHNQKYHPLCLIKQRIVDFMYKRHSRRDDNGQVSRPLFSLHDTLSPVVTTRQNFDSLLIPPDHPSRALTDTYYVNQSTLLRSHTSAHQLDLIRSGLDAFLLAGDVYRRDEIDSLHYPVFHQLEGVRLFTSEELFRDAIDPSRCLQLFEDVSSSSVYAQKCKHPFQALPSFMLPSEKQPQHTNETAKRLEFELKTVLQALAKSLFGTTCQLRWVDAYFPFTHPSWELEVKTKLGYNADDEVEEWTELLGCGLMRQELLERAGLTNKVGYAFGLGLERWAMQLYGIPDIRLFWTEDSGFLHQFETNDIHAPITYKPVSVFPPCTLDLSFWLPNSLPIKATASETSTVTSQEDVSKSMKRDFYDLVRSVAGDIIEQVRLVDKFTDPRTARQSHCYRLVYRDQHRTLTTNEVRVIHDRIANQAVEQFGVQIR